MQCEEFQEKLANNAFSETANEHLATCADCTDFAAFVHTLEHDLIELREEVALEGLRERIERQLQPKRSFGWQWWGSAGFVTAALVLAVLLGGRNSAEAAYRGLLQKMAEVKSAHAVVFWRPGNGSVENGPLRKVEDLWWVPGKLRETSLPDLGGDRIKLRTSNGWTYSHFDAARGVVETVPEVGQQINSFDINSIAMVYMQHPAQFERSAVSEASELVTVTDVQGWSRIEFYVNRKTGLPYRADKEYWQWDKWLQSGRLDLEFNIQISSSEFDPQSLKGSPER